MKKWCVGILVIMFILSSQIDIKASAGDDEELPGMTEGIDGLV